MRKSTTRELASSRKRAAKPPARGRVLGRKKVRPGAASASVESCRRKLVWVAVVLATAVLILACWLTYALGAALVGGGSWTMVYIGSPTLAAMTAVFVTLWKAAERLTLPVVSLGRRPDAIRALTGQRQREDARGRKKAVNESEKE